MLLSIHHLAEREQAHHHLLVQREPRRVVERHIAAVGDDTVDEFDLARPRVSARRNACPNAFKSASGSLAIILSKMLSSWCR